MYELKLNQPRAAKQENKRINHSGCLDIAPQGLEKVDLPAIL